MCKQHPVKHAKGRAKIDGVLVAEVTSDTPRKASCSRLQALIQNTKVAFFGLYGSAFYANYPECERKNFCKQLAAVLRIQIHVTSQQNQISVFNSFFFGLYS